MPSSVTAVNIGLMPNGSRAPNRVRSCVSQIRNANMPRNLETADFPQWWMAATIASPSPSVLKAAPNSTRSASRNSR